VLTVMSLGVNKDVLYAWRDEQREGKLDGANIFTADRGLEKCNAVLLLFHSWKIRFIVQPMSKTR
jgi:hypothetical protein